jgi:hypothetical protein
VCHHLGEERPLNRDEREEEVGATDLVVASPPCLREGTVKNALRGVAEGSRGKVQVVRKHGRSPCLGIAPFGAA